MSLFHIKRMSYANLIATLALIVMTLQNCHTQNLHEIRINNIENKTK